VVHACGVVTDSTAYLPRELALRHAIEVVPLEVVVGGVPSPEGDVSPEDLAGALRRWTPVSTSRPAPSALLAAYQRLQDAGAREIVSVHLSGEMSGTCSAARLAARSCPVPVHVVDSRQLGMGLGYAALAAAATLERGGTAEEATEAARRRAAATRGFFYVDTLEHLRRGGRIGSAQALIGTALAVKPLLHVVDGRVAPLERVRTSARALARLLELGVAAVPGAAAGAVPVEVTVHHLASGRRAEELAARLAERLHAALRPPGLPPRVIELGAVVGAHVGPGTVAVVVAPALAPSRRA